MKFPSYRRSSTLAIAGAMLLVTTIALSLRTAPNSEMPTASVPDDDPKDVDVSALATGSFMENQGQATMGVRYYSTGNPSAAFRDDGVMFVLREEVERSGEVGDLWKGPPGQPTQAMQEPKSLRSFGYLLRFEGANPVAPVGRGRLGFNGNFFLGNDSSKWMTNVPTYREVVYRNLYDGVDLLYRQSETSIKYELTVNPGADIGIIRMRYEGVESLKINDGGIAVQTFMGNVHDSPPYSYRRDGQEVNCDFVIREPFSFGFDCPVWDGSDVLVIDPLIYSTFLGGSERDMAYSIDVDHEGNAYVSGYTMSPDFPVSPGVYDTSLSEWGDAFVTKLNSTGTELVYSTFLGGSGGELVYSIVLNPSGQAYLVGGTGSSDFPMTGGALDTTFNGGFYDTFVAKLGSGGDTLLYATFLGGSDEDIAYSIALDSNEVMHLTGNTRSPDFPVTAGAFDTSFNGGSYGDAFVAKLSPNGEAFVYSTFLGGSGADFAYSVAVGSTGSTYVAGCTRSFDFPTTPNAYDATYNGDIGGSTCGDAFVAKLRATGDILEYATFLGGTDDDWGASIALDPQGNMYVGGATMSDDFPVTPEAFGRLLRGHGDMFVTRIDCLGRTLNYSTYLGGSDWDNGGHLVLDSLGSAYVVGFTMSTDFPVTPDGFDTAPNVFQGVLAKVDATGSTIVYGTFIGGSKEEDYSRAVALDSVGNVYVTGYTLSTDFPTTPGAFDTTYNGGFYDAYVLKLSIQEGGTNHAPTIYSFSGGRAPEGQAAVFTVSASDPDGDTLTYAFDLDSDGCPDVSGPNNTASRVWGDDYTGIATVNVSDGRLFVEASTTIVVYNVKPSIWPEVTVSMAGSLTLRVAGEKYHDVTATVYLNGAGMHTGTVTRAPGSPDEQAVMLGNVTMDFTGNDTWSARLVYTPLDDPINGRVWGATPAWLMFESKHGKENMLHHTFNARHEDTWTWDIPDLRAQFSGIPLDFQATATDPGSDDLTFTWDWGDGSPVFAMTYFNDGIGPDPYPSPDLNAITATSEVSHVYLVAGTLTITLTVADDDGGHSSHTFWVTV